MLYCLSSVVFYIKRNYIKRLQEDVSFVFDSHIRLLTHSDVLTFRWVKFFSYRAEASWPFDKQTVLTDMVMNWLDQGL